MFARWTVCIVCSQLALLPASAQQQPLIRDVGLNTPEPAAAFIENRGQVTDQHGTVREDVRYLLAGRGCKVHVRDRGFSYELLRTSFDGTDERASRDAGKGLREDDACGGVFRLPQHRWTAHRIDIDLIGATAGPAPRGEQEVSGRLHFYTSYAPDGGIAGVSLFRSVRYTDVYPGIDLRFESGATTPVDGSPQVKYEFIVRPGADPSRIRLRYKGAEGLLHAPDGTLLVRTSLGQVREGAPYCVTRGAQGKRAVVASRYRVDGAMVSFELGSYASDDTLIIDPSIMWASYYGASGYDGAYGVTVDASGNVYMLGFTTSSAMIATAGAHMVTYGGGHDAFLAKFSPSGTRLWATYYGGIGDEDGSQSVVVDGSDNVYIVGTTNSTSGIATAGAHQTAFGGTRDGFVAAFDSSGVRRWGTYYGGAGDEVAGALTIDPGGYIYLSGHTLSSTGIATTGTHQQTLAGSYDAFVAKLTVNGTREWGTYFGGSGEDHGHSIERDGNGDVVLVGFTSSTAGIATAGAFQTAFGGGGDDAYIVKFTAAGSVVWASYYGGGGGDDANGVAIDEDNNLFVQGNTYSSSGFATAGCHQSAFGGNIDGYLAKFTSAGRRVWGTYYGGGGEDRSFGVSCRSRRIYFSGSTGSTNNIATATGPQPSCGGSNDGFMVRFDTTGTRVWGTYFGGSGWEYGRRNASDPGGYVYFIGNTESGSGISTAGAHQTSYGGGSDAFIVQISDTLLPTITTLPVTGSPFCAGAAVTVPFSITGSFNAGNVFSAQLSGPSGGFGSPVVIGTLPGTAAGTINGTIPDTVSSGTGYRIRVVASSPAVTGSNNGGNLTVYALPQAVITPQGPTVFCDGDSVLLQANSGASYGYQWMRNNAPIGGATSVALVAKSSGAYTVIVTGAGGCIDTSAAVAVTVHPLPQAVITPQGPTTFCAGGNVVLEADSSAGDTFQWRRNGAPIGGAVYRRYSAAQDGSYTVTVTDVHGCQATSPAVALQQYPADPTSLVWTGTIGRDWSTPGNWDNPCVIPTTGDTVLIPPAPTPPLAVPAISLSKLTLDNAGGLALSGGLIITSTLVLANGAMTLHADTLTIEAPAAISQASSSSFILTDGVGALRQRGIGATGRNRNVEFPVGGRGGSYTPLQLTNAGQDDDFTVRATGAVLDGGSSGSAITTHVVGATWLLDERVQGGSNTQIALIWSAGDELPLFQRTKCFIARYDGNAWSPLQQAGAVAGSNPYVRTVTGITAFGPFAVGDSASALPVELVDLRVSIAGRSALLEWSTAGETNNRGFVVERVMDGDPVWRDRAFVPSAAGEGRGAAYRACDTVPAAGRWWYRLRQIDVDGHASISRAVSVDCEERAQLAIGPVTPHPVAVHADAFVAFAVPGPGALRVSIHDVLGREQIVLADDPAASACAGTVRIPAGTLDRGIHIIVLQHAGGTRALPMVVLR